MQIVISIIAGTPLWVWPLLVALIWLELGRTKTREVSTALLLISPVVFGVWVIVKLALSGLASIYVFGTLGGLVLGALLVTWLRPARAATRLPNGKIRIEGEWISLGTMMLVFFSNYAVGVLAVIAPQLITSPNFQFGIALINAFSATLMVGRTYAYLRTKPQAEAPTRIALSPGVGK